MFWALGYRFLLSCCLDCSTAVGMEDGRIKDYQVTGSAVYQHHKASRGRLNNITKRVNGTQWGAWCSDILDQNQYLQVCPPTVLGAEKTKTLWFSTSLSSI